MARDRLRQLPVTYLTYVLLGAGTLVFASTIPVFPWAPWTLRFPIDINSTSHSSSAPGLTTTSWVSSSLPPFLRSIPCDTITTTTLLRVLGTVLVLVSSFFFFYLRRLVLKAFTNYTRESLEGDMKDIIEFYKLKEAAPVADSTKEDSIPIPIPIPERQWEPSGTKAFWIAELIGSGEIVGCIALGEGPRGLFFFFFLLFFTESRFTLLVIYTQTRPHAEPLTRDPVRCLLSLPACSARCRARRLGSCDA